MKLALTLFVVSRVFCLHAPAIAVQDYHSVDGMLEEPPGVRIVSSLGFAPSTGNPDPRYAAEDAAVSDSAQETASLVFEITGPRTVRLHHWSAWPNTGGSIWLRVDGQMIREFDEPLPTTSDLTISGGAHHVEILCSSTPMALFKIVDVAADLPVLTKPDLMLPAGGEVSLRLPVQSDSPVTWSAAGLPDGLALDATTGRITGVAGGLSYSGTPVSAWVTMTNAHGTQVEQLRIWGMNPLEHVSPAVSLAGRRARQEGTREFLFSTESRYDTALPQEGYVGRGYSADDKDGVPEVVTTVQGPDTLWFRSRNSIEKPGPVVVKIGGVEMLRAFARANTDDELSVSIPEGTHEVTWEFPRGGRIDRVRLDSVVEPRLRGPFTLTALPGVPFTHTVTAEAGAGPIDYYTTAPLPGMSLDDDTGILSGSLEAGDYWIPVSAFSGGLTDTTVYHLQVRGNAAAVLGKPGLNWLQTAGPAPWQSTATGPGGSTVWEFHSTTQSIEPSRMETVIEGPDMVSCRFQPLGPASLALELDGQRTVVPRTFADWENFLTVRIPPGRHLLALHATKSAAPGGVRVMPLQFAGAGAPVVAIPPRIYTDGTPVRIPFQVSGGPAENIAASGLPEGFAISGHTIAGSMITPENTVWSVVSAARAGQTVSTRVEWVRNDLNGWIDSEGWYAWADRFTTGYPFATGGWDGIAALSLGQIFYGTQEFGVGRLITGPDTLTFRRRSGKAVRMEVKVDGAPVHTELVDSDLWQQVSIPVPSGEHHVTIAALPKNPGDGTTASEYDNGSQANLILDDFRLHSDPRPAITDSRRRLEAMPGQSFTFSPQFEKKVREWRVTELPAGFTFDADTGVLKAATVTAPPGEYPLIITAENAYGLDKIGVTLVVVAPPAIGDSPRLLLQKDGWSFAPGPKTKGASAVEAIDGGDVHYSAFNSLGRMSAWVEGPDIVQFWWHYTAGDTWFEVHMDGVQVYDPVVAFPSAWKRQEIAVPAGRHLITWLGYDNVVVDHITLASDRIPQLLTQQAYVVDPAGFSIQLQARNAPTAWSAEGFTVSSSGVLSGTFPPGEDRIIRISATNAAGTGYGAIILRPHTALSEVLDSSLMWSTEAPEAWWPEAPAPGVLPRPADDQDFLRSAGYDPLLVEIPPGGGFLSFWVKSPVPLGALEVSIGPSHPRGPGFYFNLPDMDWHRVVIPASHEGTTLLIRNPNHFVSGVLFLDRAELVRPGDPFIDLTPLPGIRAGVPYSGQLKLLTGGPVHWQVTGLPAGLTLDSTTGIISGTIPSAATAVARHELRITATTEDGRSTFAWMLMRPRESLDSALDTHTLTWHAAGRSPTTHWRQGLVAGTGTHGSYGPHDGTDYATCVVGPDGLATLSTTVTGPGTLSFWWAGPTFDPPHFYVDEVLRAVATYSIHSLLRRYVIEIPAGEHELRWEVTNLDESEDGEGYLDRVLWSGDAAPLFTCETFDIEASPGSGLSSRIPSNGAPVFTGSDLPNGFTLNAGTGLLSGIAPASEGVYPFNVTIEEDGRTDTARFRLIVRPPTAETLDTPGAVWIRPAESAWQSVDDPAVVRPGGGPVLAVKAPVNGERNGEELELFVEAPCFVTWWAKMTGTNTNSQWLYVTADDLHRDAVYSGRGPGDWRRGLVAVPGSGRRSVRIFGMRYTDMDGVYLDEVKILPWHADANNDGLPNAMACALARWPDAISEGDPLFQISPHPSVPNAQLVSFGSGIGIPALFPTRDHAINLSLEQSTGFTGWQPASATVETIGGFTKSWRIQGSADPRTFRRVRALPLTGGGP